MAWVSKVISGGQTGVDRAALDAAIHLRLETGGWCPRNRWAEDGAIPGKYPLNETQEVDPSERTALNVQDAAATLILHDSSESPGSRLTEEIARSSGKPCLVANLHHPRLVQSVRRWLERVQPGVLNIAGPRASESPAIYDLAYERLIEILRS